MSVIECRQPPVREITFTRPATPENRSVIMALLWRLHRRGWTGYVWRDFDGYALFVSLKGSGDAESITDVRLALAMLDRRSRAR